ncbi:MAG: hypothetical protein ABWK01_06870 [Infirmifilum sp.]
MSQNMGKFDELRVKYYLPRPEEIAPGQLYHLRGAEGEGRSSFSNFTCIGLDDIEKAFEKL